MSSLSFKFAMGRSIYPDEETIRQKKAENIRKEIISKLEQGISRINWNDLYFDEEVFNDVIQKELLKENLVAELFKSKLKGNFIIVARVHEDINYYLNLGD